MKLRVGVATRELVCSGRAGWGMCWGSVAKLISIVGVAVGLAGGFACQTAAGLLLQTQDAGSAAGQTDAPKKPMRIRQGGNVAAASLLERVTPIYPPLARATRISGTVRLHAVIGTDGLVKQLEVLSGHPLLVQSALDAVRKWKYRPTTLNGEPVEIDTTIDVIFSLEQDSSEGPAKPIDPQLRADILQLLEVTHFKTTMTESAPKLFEPMRPMLLSTLPASLPDRNEIVDAYIAKLLGLLQTDEFVEQIVAIYGKYFSDEDIKAMTAFYETPAGQHFSQVMPDVFGEMNRAGQRVAMQNIPEIMKELCREFPELQDAPSFCPQGGAEKKGERSSGT
jgi:TonB family protein